MRTNLYRSCSTLSIALMMLAFAGCGEDPSEGTPSDSVAIPTQHPNDAELQRIYEQIGNHSDVYRYADRFKWRYDWLYDKLASEEDKYRLFMIMRAHGAWHAAIMLEPYWQDSDDEIRLAVGFIMVEMSAGLATEQGQYLRQIVPDPAMPEGIAHSIPILYEHLEKQDVKQHMEDEAVKLGIALDDWQTMTKEARWQAVKQLYHEKVTSRRSSENGAGTMSDTENSDP